MATGILESVRPKGVELLDVILDKVNPDDFGDCSESLCRVENECMNESSEWSGLLKMNQKQRIGSAI